MAYSDSTYSSNDKLLLTTMLLSVVVHALAVAYLNPFEFEAARATPPLVVELQQPKPEPPPPEPEPPKPEPPKPQPPKPEPKKLPPPLVKTPLPPPVERAVVPDAPPPPPPPQVMAAAQEKVAEPTFVTHAPEPEKPRPPEPIVDEQPDLGKYGEMLAREFAKHKQYPRIAQMRGWQGTVRVKLDVENGTVVASSISESSGYEALDKQALETARKGKLFPPLPDSMKTRVFTITVPIVFRLE